MNSEDFCRAFCSGLEVREVPIGYVLQLPFNLSDGDALAIYVRRLGDDRYRLEDDGQVLPLLDAVGVDFDTESRFEALADLLREYEAYLDERESVIHSQPMLLSALPAESVRFAALLLRMQDFALLAPNRVRSTFYEDLLELIRRQFGSQATIETKAVLQPSMRDYVVDILIRAPDNRGLAVYAATSERKALEALLFWREVRDQEIKNARGMLVVETAKPRDIRERTFSRVLNSGLLLASMDGEEIAIGRKMRESLLQ